MKPGLLRGGYRNPLQFALIAFSCGALSFFSGWSSGDEHELAGQIALRMQRQGRAQAVELGVHHPFPFDWLCRISQVSSSRTCWISSTEAAGDSAAARIRSKASAQVRTSRSFSR